ncbi:hypothetical protein NGM10_05985 [Halorussus salilacus]|uniref:hypothetical protein n=1 Tax=Halorussus salilacus TaxID=2953750 RepID=UPI00209DAC51|nr:hypothetical protein [Halorussus salilacus]USZ69284.1 hypothetical protein NGM10_05985 [Halorussus salilacus]
MSTLRRAVVPVVSVLLVAGLLAVGPPGDSLDGGLPWSDSSSAAASSATAPDDETLVQPSENGSLLWPYTSSSRSPEDRTLAINVVIHGERDEVRRALTDRSNLDWNRTTGNETEADAETYSVELTDDGIEWNDARGSTRYTYLDAGPRGGTGRWVDESYQLHAGDYLGARQHVRAYESPRADDEWTAVQAHAEYWDWFRLRHTVTNVQGAARTVEADFMDEPYVSEVRREYHGNRGGRHDGWISAIELALAAGVVGVSLTGSRSVREVGERAGRALADNGHRILLVVALLGLYLGVRTTGLALERAFPGVSPKLFAGLLYPVVAFGIPTVAALTARPLDRAVAFGLTVVALGAAFVLDFSAVGVGIVPIDLVLHRVALLLSVGLIAAGSARRRADPDLAVVGVGTVGWVASLIMPLFGML